MAYPHQMDGSICKIMANIKTEYNYSCPGSQRETLKKGEWVMTRLDKPLRHEGGEKIII